MDSKAPLIASRTEFRAALAWGFETAIAQGTRRIVCADTDFSAWPWDEQATLDRIAAWLRLPQRQLLLLAREFDSVPRLHPRFNRWRVDWSHAIEGRQVPQDWPQAVPALLVADGTVSVHLLDALHWRGRASLDARDAQQGRESIDVVLQRSVPALAAATLGL